MTEKIDGDALKIGHNKDGHVVICHEDQTPETATVGLFLSPGQARAWGHLLINHADVAERVGPEEEVRKAEAEKCLRSWEKAKQDAEFKDRIYAAVGEAFLARYGVRERPGKE